MLLQAYDSGSWRRIVVLQDSGEKLTVERVSNSLRGRLDLMTWVISVLLKEQEPVLDQDERRDRHDGATRRTGLRYERHVGTVPSVAVTMTQGVLQETSCLITANVRMDSSASQSC